LRRNFSGVRSYTPAFPTRGDSARFYLQLGFQVIELMIAVAITAIIAIIAVPSYSRYKDKANDATAEADIVSISQAIERYYDENNAYPNSLNDVHMGTLMDPWGHPYQYLRINGGNIKGNSQLRKDKNLVPINSDYDLYSMGKDGASAYPLTAAFSQDDIVRANNGKFVGLAADY
jgi:general secretion pathway protein G